VIAEESSRSRVHQRAVAKLEKNVKIFVPKKTSTIVVRGQAESPELAQRIVGTLVSLYLDEHLVGRYPTVARCYSSTGAPGMQARQYAASGAVIAKRYGSVTVGNFLKVLQIVEAQYPDAEVIYIALDNWTVHVNERVLPALQARQSKIQLLFQPTYAPWTNPMEKVWLRFNEDVSHMHPHWAKWQPWRLRIDDWIAQVRPASQAMLQATGLASLSYLAPPAIIHFKF